jgi:hypothetical protein
VLTTAFHVLSNSEIASILEHLKNCEALGVDNSLMRVGGDVRENCIIHDREKIQKLGNVLGNIEYKRIRALGVAATKELIDIHIVSKNPKQLDSLRVIGRYLEIGKVPKFHRYRSSDEDLIDNVRNALGVSNVELDD